MRRPRRYSQSQMPLAFTVDLLSDAEVFSRLIASGTPMFSSAYDVGPVGSRVAAFGRLAEIIDRRTRAEFLSWESATFPEYPSMLDSDDCYFWEVRF